MSSKALLSALVVAAIFVAATTGLSHHNIQSKNVDKLVKDVDTLVKEVPVGKWARYEAMVKAMNSNSMLDDIWDKEHFPKFKGGQSQSVPEGSLQCPPFGPSTEKPTSVHKLRPTDVDLVAAIGDSLTAANGALAKTPLGLLTEYRGRSFSMGGDKDASSVVTMPNILRTHVDDLHGHSSGSGKQGSKGAKLNFAVPGSTAKDLHGQALKLVDELRNDPNVDFDNDWKVITVFVGGNDACDYFDGEKDANSPNKYIEGVKRAVDVFHATVPRAFVNLVEVLDLSMLPDLSKGLICPLLHRYLCNHIASGKDNAAVKHLIEEYNQEIFKLVSGGRYETRDDFTVVIQPFLRNTTYPRRKNGEPDLSFFAPDCFHFSAKGHASAGEALWNNMLEPVGQKSTQWSPEGNRARCPTPDSPFLATYQNSHGAKFAAFHAYLANYQSILGAYRSVAELVSNKAKSSNVATYQSIIGRAAHGLPSTDGPSSGKWVWIGGGVAFVGICLVVGLIAVVVKQRRRRRPLGESLADLPREIEEENRRETRLNVPLSVPLSVANELYEELHQTNEHSCSVLG